MKAQLSPQMVVTDCWVSSIKHQSMLGMKNEDAGRKCINIQILSCMGLQWYFPISHTLDLSPLLEIVHLEVFSGSWSSLHLSFGSSHHMIICSLTPPLFPSLEKECLDFKLITLFVANLLRLCSGLGFPRVKEVGLVFHLKYQFTWKKEFLLIVSSHTG